MTLDLMDLMERKVKYYMINILSTAGVTLGLVLAVLAGAVFIAYIVVIVLKYKDRKYREENDLEINEDEGFLGLFKRKKK